MSYSVAEFLVSCILDLLMLLLLPV